MRPSSFIIVAFSALSMAAPVADPEAAANALAIPEAEAEAITSPVESSAEVFARTEKSKACCPRGKKTGCRTWPLTEKCPAHRPDQYSQCSGLGQLGLVNVLLCNVLNDNTVNIPITVGLLRK